MAVAAAARASLTVGLVTVTPRTTSATSGATLTSPNPETVMVCSGVPVVSAAEVEWLAMIGPASNPTIRLNAAVTATIRPIVRGPGRPGSAAAPAGALGSCFALVVSVLIGFSWLAAGLRDRRGRADFVPQRAVHPY